MYHICALWFDHSYMYAFPAYI